MSQHDTKLPSAHNEDLLSAFDRSCEIDVGDLDQLEVEEGEEQVSSQQQFDHPSSQLQEHSEIVQTWCFPAATGHGQPIDEDSLGNVMVSPITLEVNYNCNSGAITTSSVNTTQCNTPPELLMPTLPIKVEPLEQSPKLGKRKQAIVCKKEKVCSQNTEMKYYEMDETDPNLSLSKRRKIIKAKKSKRFHDKKNTEFKILQSERDAYRNLLIQLGCTEEFLNQYIETGLQAKMP